MTLIIGLKYGGKVYMGADSGLTVEDDDGTAVYCTSAPKLFRKGPPGRPVMLVGAGGNPRISDLVRYSPGLAPPEPWPPQSQDSDTIPRYMTMTFVSWLRELLAGHGFDLSKITPEDVVNSHALIVAIGGRLFSVDAWNGANETTLPGLCLGEGGRYAEGYMAALLDHQATKRCLLSPDMVIKYTLDAVVDRFPIIRQPYTVLVEEGLGEDSVPAGQPHYPVGGGDEDGDEY